MGIEVQSNPPLGMCSQDEPILIADEYNGAQQATVPDETGFYTIFIEGQGNPQILWVLKMISY